MENHFKNTSFVLRKFSKKVDAIINDILASHVSREHQGLVQYHFLTGGKRLRPALAIASCKMFGGKTKDILYPAAGLEILHNYTLIIDDIIDNSTLRRGKTTVWAKFGRSMAECISWSFAASAFQAVSRAPKQKEITELFAKSLKTVMQGEIMDILFEQWGRGGEPYVVKNRYRNVEEKDYFLMASRKTAALFGACCEVGGLVASAGKKEISHLRGYGLKLGVAFQIQDDILDIFGDQGKFGKVIGGDIKERKLGNIVMLKSFRDLSSGDKKDFLAILRKDKLREKDVKKGMALIKKTNSKRGAQALAGKFVEEAKEELKDLPKNEWRNFLFELADFVMARGE